jgi:hypothetical protein
LPRIPAGRVFLGIDAGEITSGTPAYRLSHANGEPQTYSAGVVGADEVSCLAAPAAHFIYSRLTAGVVAPGSSGAPLLLPGLRVAGQLLGICQDAQGGCSEPRAVDGSIRSAWPLLSAYLDPPPPARRRSARH